MESEKKDISLPAPKKVQTIVEYAKDNGITRQTVYNHIKEGKLIPVKLGSQQFIPIK